MDLSLQFVKIVVTNLPLFSNNRHPIRVEAKHTTSTTTSITQFIINVYYYFFIVNSLVVFLQNFLHLFLKGKSIHLIFQLLLQRKYHRLNCRKTAVILLDRTLMEFLHIFSHILDLAVDRVGETVESTLLTMEIEFMLDDLVVNLFVEFAVVKEDSIHLLELLYNEVTLVNHRFYRDAATYEILIDSNEFSKLLVIHHFFEASYLILQTNH